MPFAQQPVERRRRLLQAGLAGLCCGAGVCNGQAFPAGPVRILMPFAAGGGSDLLVRAQAREISRLLGVPVLVDNRPGGGGVVAATATARAAADGHTITLGTSAHMVNVFLLKDPGYDPLADFAPISLCWASGAVLVVPASSSVRTLDGLVGDFRKASGTWNYASGGVGTVAHLSAATFAKVIGASAVHVPYRGAGEIVPALVSGTVQFAFPIASTAIPAVTSGAIRPLAVTTNARMAQLPGVPTLLEHFGDDRLEQEAWGGWWAPKGTSATLVNALFGVNRRSLAAADVLAFFERSATSARVSESPAEFGHYMARELDRWRRVALLVGLERA